MQDRARFEALIQRLESEASTSPVRYRLLLAALGVLGYLFLFLVLAMVAASLALFFYVVASVRGLQWVFAKLGWAILAVALVVVRALWVKIPEPGGIPIPRRVAPRLYEMLDDVRAVLHSPRVHRVLLTQEFNAAIVQVPRLGLLGWPRNYLLLGLPLMMGLGTEDFRAVVAHEFGHLSGNHGAFGAWIYRMRQTWERVLQGLEEESLFDFGLRSFYRWYVPYFDAFSFVLARAQEYVADACAAEVTDRRTACSTLVLIAVQGSHLAQTVWPGILAGVSRDPDPPRAVFREVQGALERGSGADAARGALAVALHERTAYGDTHPALADRLRAMDPNTPLGVEDLEALWSARARGPSAAEQLLEGKLDELLEKMDLDWRDSVLDKWGHRHRVMLKQRADLEALDQAANERELTEEEAWNRVQGTLTLRGSESGLSLLRSFVEAYPRHAPAQFALGRVLFENGDESGLANIEQAMGLDPNAVLPACAAVELHLVAQGRGAEAEAWRDRARRFVETLQAARQEREDITADDSFLPHGLSDEALKSFREAFAGLPLRRVLMAQKTVEHFPDSHAWIVGLSVRPRGGLLRSRDIEASVFESLKEAWSESGMTFFIIEDNEAISEALERVEGSDVYHA